MKTFLIGRPKTMIAPDLEHLIQIVKSSVNDFRSKPIINKKFALKAEKVLSKIEEAIQPRISVNDRIWSFWLRIERGSLEDFGDFQEYIDEGAVESFEEFEELWKMDFPDEFKWYQAVVVSYKRELNFGLGNEWRFGVNLENNEVLGINFDQKEAEELVDWFFSILKNEVAKFEKNPEEYNLFIDENLPLNKRYGKVVRMKLWEGIKDWPRLDKELGPENIKKLEEAINKFSEEDFIESMTADDFFKYCEICYDAVPEFKKGGKGRSPREKYKAFADRRDDGLLEIEGGSETALKEWFQSSRFGGHPWEICRGGNSTHISLFIHEPRDDNGWRLRLAGSAVTRVAETVRMAVALYEKNIPFILSDGPEILRMVKGEDYIGIVPEDVTPRYCHGNFPDEDMIIDFINPRYLEEDMASCLTSNAEWYPLDSLQINKASRD